MTFTLQITTDNDAFQPDPQIETARILREIANRLDQVIPARFLDRQDGLGDYADGGWTGHFQTIHDANGNDVGRYAFKSK